MSDHPSRFDAYGAGGDYAGARRLRRAFRYGVLACLCFTFALFFSENYLRHDLLETQYMMSVTLDEPSARAILRNVVRRDSEQNDRPTPRYLNALAEIEEVDVMAEAYASAYMREPNNAFLVISYGCYLFHEGQYREARERFREAGILPPNNALPRYLEAAALSLSLDDEDDFSEVLTLIVRTNNSGDPILFPEPPWHHTLPKHGYWYMKRQREIIDHCLAPLYRMKSRLLARAQDQIDSGQVQDWSSWLGSVENMGARFIGLGNVEGSLHSSATAQFGLTLKQDILALRAQIQAQQPRYASAAVDIAAQREKLSAAQARIFDFENERDAHIAAHQALVAQPLYLVFHSLLALLLAYGLARIAMRLAGIRVNSQTMQEIPVARTVLIGGLALMAFLLLLSIFTRQGHGSTMLPTFIHLFWYGLLSVLLGFGLVYPLVWLPAPRQVVAHAPVYDSGDSMLKEAKSAKLTAWFSFVVRYYGILLGGFLVVVCFWVLAHRMVASLYPTQIRLLATGLFEEELRLVQQIQLMLGN